MKILLHWLSAAALLLLVPPLAPAFAASSNAPAGANAEPSPASPPAPGAAFAPGGKMTTYVITYLGKNYPEPTPLSFLDPSYPSGTLPGEGFDGAALGIKDNNRTGQFLGQEYKLEKHVLPANANVKTEAKKLLDSGHKLIIADLKKSDLLAVADLPEAKDAIILNIRSSDDSLRQQDCRANLFHILPSDAMRADALAQFLIWKKWPRWFLLEGTSARDAEYAAAVKRAAKRFGGQIVEQKTYAFKAGENRTDTGHQQIQTQMPMETQGAPNYDVLWADDHEQAFGEYLPYNLTDPRPVVGTQGLVAVAWNRAYEEYSGMQLQDEFHRFSHRWMTERDYAGWLAGRIFGEAATRSRATTPTAIKAYMLSDKFKVGADKGLGLTFRPWDNQLRQPVLISGPRMLVSISPQEGFLHPKYLTDTLGYDKPETKCKMAQPQEAMR